MAFDIAKTTKKIQSEAKKVLSAARYEHSLRVANTAEILAKKNSLSEKRARLAGISHDLCKDMKPEEILSLALLDKNEITAIEMAHPSLLHGRAAAIRLAKDFDVYDADVLEAVACHTFGKLGMCALSKLLYIADKIEPGRPNISSEYFHSLINLPLDEIMIRLLKNNFSDLKDRGLQAAEESKRLLRELEAHHA